METPRSSWRRTAVSLGLLALLLAGFGWALAGHWAEVRERLTDQNPAVVLGAFAVTVTAVVMTFAVWRGTLAVLGSRVAPMVGARIFFVGQLGKYLPGSVWPLVVQMRLGREVGLPRTRVALAFVLTLGLSLLWGAGLGLTAVPSLARAEGGGAVWLLLVVPVAAVLLVPRVLNAALTVLLRVTRRPPLDAPVAGRDVVRGSGWTLAYFLVQGAAVWLLAVGLGADPWPAVPASIGGFALAFAVGLLFVVVPAGAGVRETVLVVVLGSVLPTADAAAVALTSRALLMVTDGLLALTGLWGRPRVAWPSSPQR